MTIVKFNTGIPEIDQFWEDTPEFGFIFTAINLNRLSAKSRQENGHPVITPSLVEVAPYTDIDDNMSYAIKSYADLDGGRIVVSDFHISQRWSTEGDKNVMSLVTEDGAIMLRDLGNLAISLAVIADTYRVMHHIKSMNE